MFSTGLRVSDWMTATRLKAPQNKQEMRHQNCGIGWPNIFLLSQADLIVRWVTEEFRPKGVTGSTLFSHPGFPGLWRWGSACQIKSHSWVSPPLLSCIFIGALGAHHFWKFTKRLTAKINNKKCPLLNLLTLWL